MGRRIATLLAPTDLGASGTKPIDINLRGQISRIAIKWKYTVATVSVMIEDILACLSKIELVDGSDVKFATSGKAAQGVNFYNQGVLPRSYQNLTVGGIPEAVVTLDFGRYLWDPAFALRPELMKNPQLKITYDEDAASASAVVNSLAVYAFVDDTPQGGGAGGYIRTREIYQYGFAASGHEYIDLPVDYPLRTLFFQALSTDHDTLTLLDSIKIDVENGRHVPVDMLFADYFDFIKMAYGAITLNPDMDAAVTAKDLYVPTSQENRIAIQYDATAFVTAQSKFALAAYKGQFIDIAASVDIKAQTAIVTGFMPQGIMPFRFGDPMIPESWMPVSGVKNIRADVLASSDADSGDTATLITEQMVNY